MAGGTVIGGFDVGRFVPDPAYEEAQRRTTAMISEGFCPRDRTRLDIAPTATGELAGWCPSCGDGWSATNDPAYGGGPTHSVWYSLARPGR